VNINIKSMAKYSLLAVVTVASLHMGSALAADGATSYGIGRVSDSVRGGMTSLANLITAASFVMGFGFAAAAILKFKAHKDNPAQIPVGTPIALLFIAAALIYLPSMYGAIGETLFGADGATPGNASKGSLNDDGTLGRGKTPA
jgi:intracellular multiplication protein IcmD